MIPISAEKEKGEDTGIYDCIPLNHPNEQRQLWQRTSTSAEETSVPGACKTSISYHSVICHLYSGFFWFFDISHHIKSGLG